MRVFNFLFAEFDYVVFSIELFNNCKGFKLIASFAERIAAALETFFNCNSKSFNGCAGLVYDINKSVKSASDCKEIVNDKNLIALTDEIL